ncbi:MAG: hypothetical protein DRN04_13970 [Thermoprotei archaeon]|nr:MAG: hypothetical protein DRN04_13970 [Thermoprotei archaeon]
MFLKLRCLFRDYLKKNWGSPFIMIFIALLAVAAGYLIMGAKNTAELLAECAYYSLVIGVVLQLVCYIKYGEEK